VSVADWALVISICSAVVSAAGFIWNVWSKFIYPKPRVRVSFSFMTMMVPAPAGDRSITRSENNALALSATNHGPIEVTLYNVVGAVGFRWWKRRPVRIGLLNPIPRFPDYPGQFSDEAAGPFAGGLPKKVAVGEQFASYFIPDHEALAKDEIVRVGFTDTFGRYHWAPGRDLIKARKHIREECTKVGKRWE
jgi:hypothetical protein